MRTAPQQLLKSDLDTISDKTLGKELFSMTWPMLIGVLSLMSFQLADSLFIARLGVESLAVVGFTIPIYLLIIGFQVGFGIATTALISQQVGAKQESSASTLGGTILCFGGAVLLGLCVLIWFAREPILGALGGSPALMPLINEFWLVWLISAYCGALVYLGYSICRAHGNTVLPGAVMVVTSLLNIGLDPLFIFYFDFGLKGAAYATLCSFTLGACFVFPKLLRSHWLSFKRIAKDLQQSVKNISAIAAPAIMSQMLPPLAAMMATYIVAQFGTEAVAAWGLGTRLEFFSIVMVLALTMALPPIIGRNYGAGQFDRIAQVTRLTLKFVMLWQFCIALGGIIFSHPLSRLMASNDAVAEILQLYLAAVPISYGPLGVCMIAVSICNAMNAPLRALNISFLRLFICYLPFVWAGALLGDMQGLIIGATVGNSLAGIMAWRAYQSCIKKVSTP